MDAPELKDLKNRLNHKDSAMYKRMTTLLLALLLTCTAAWAQATAPRAATPVFDPNAFLAPFLDDQTIAVAHVDAAKIDTATLQTYIKSLVDEFHMPPDANLDKQLTDARAAADSFLNRFRQLGGRHLFAVLNQPDLWPHLQPMAILIKIEPGGNAKALAQLLAGTFPTSEITPEELKKELTAPDQAPPLEPTEQLKIAVLRDDLVFLGQRVPLRRLAARLDAKVENRMGRLGRPELHFTATDAALEAVAALTADDRRALKELMPTLPQELGGTSTDFLTREPLTTRLELTLPPKPLVRLSFSRPGNAPVSDELNTVLLNLRDRLLTAAPFTQFLDQPQLKPQAANLTAALKEILTPKPGPALTLEDPQIRSVLRILVPALEVERARARRMMSANNLKQIVQACYIYANENKDILPESLDTIVKLGQVPPQTLINPNDDKHRRYVYSPPTIPLAKVPAPSTYPLIWEEIDNDAEPRNVGFLDGHVELVRNRAALDALLKAAAPATPPHAPGLP
jgi:prepilin-type processing-associated H-X9-DG protein